MMARTPKIIIALLVCATPALAQNAAPADTSSIILAQKPAPAAPAPQPAPHASSSEINAAIAAGVPAYDAGTAVPAVAAVPQDLRDADKPRNEIPRLPLEMMSRYVVRSSRLPVFRDIDLYTKAGLIDLSFKAHPGLRIGNIFNLNSAAAFEAAMKEHFISSRQDLVDTALAMAAGGDPSEAQAVQDSIIDESFRSATQVGPVGTGPAAH
jgi:hypothetical protein